MTDDVFRRLSVTDEKPLIRTKPVMETGVPGINLQGLSECRHRGFEVAVLDQRVGEFPECLDVGRIGLDDFSIGLDGAGEVPGSSQGVREVFRHGGVVAWKLERPRQDAGGCVRIPLPGEEPAEIDEGGYPNSRRSTRDCRRRG